jgi:hypothetical protein
VNIIIHAVHLLVIIFFYVIQCTDMEHIELIRVSMFTLRRTNFRHLGKFSLTVLNLKRIVPLTLTVLFTVVKGK